MAAHKPSAARARHVKSHLPGVLLNGAASAARRARLRQPDRPGAVARLARIHPRDRKLLHRAAHRVPEIDLDGFEIFIPASAVGALKGKFHSAGVVNGGNDTWEIARGLNPNVADNNGASSTGYTNLENYLNTLAGDCSPCI